MSRIARVLLMGAVGVGVTGACLFAYLYWISGPTIEVSSTQDSLGVEVDTRFVGEYHLGLTSLTISAKSGEAVATLQSEGGQIPSVFRLVPGPNRLKAIGRQGANATFAPFTLEPNHSYSIEVCGNNGFGSIHCSSAGFSL